jgi:hypothetical protein
MLISSEQSLFQLSPEQQNEIVQGRADIKNGNFIEIVSFWDNRQDKSEK